MSVPRLAATNQAALPDTPFYITRFANLFEYRGDVLTYPSRSSFFTALQETREALHEAMPAWSPATFDRDIRGPSKVESVNAIVLRYSGANTTLQEAFDLWSEEAFDGSTSCLVFTHDINGPAAPPFCVVIPFRRAITRAECEEVAATVLDIARRHGHEVAASANDPSALCPWPSIRSRILRTRDTSEGLDVDSLVSRSAARPGPSVPDPPSNVHLRSSSSFILDKLLGEVRGSTRDTDKALNRAAFVAALQIAKGNLDEGGTTKELVKAGIDAGLGAGKAEQVVERAIREGKAKAAVQGGAERWDDARIKRTKVGGIDGTHISNVILILSDHPSWKNVVRYSEFDHRIHLVNPPFRGAFYAATVKEQKWIEDNDLTCIRSWLETTLDVTVPKELLVDALVAVGMRQAFHPVREWLEHLVWDGAPRIESWLKDYCGAEVEAESQRIAVPAMSKRWMISAVARAYKPGAKVDCTLVLEGEQSIKKSTTFATLVPNEAWFSDERLNLDSKDTLQQIQGKWIIEIAELASFRGKANEEIKHFLTKKADDFRMPYGKINQPYPRQCVFGGTVNDVEYLSDPTGNRRFLPVRCHGLEAFGGKIDVDGLRKVRDQLWAEAVHRYKAGEQWWLTEAEDEAARMEQEARFMTDAWESRVAEWLATYDANGNLQDKFTMDQVLRAAVHIEPSKQGKPEQSRMKTILGRLGYYRTQVTIDGKREWRYCRKA